MTPDEVGVYILLLCHQWDGGPIPLDESEWPALTNGAPVEVTRTVVQRAFNERSNGWVNERLEEVRNEQKTRAERLSRAASIAGQASAKVRRSKGLERPFNDRST